MATTKNKLKFASTKPIAVELVGGLGNQLFGYFAGHLAAHENGTKLLLDLAQLDKGITAHGSSIESFELPESFIRSRQETRFPVLLTRAILDKVMQLAPKSSEFLERLTGIHTSRPVGLDPNFSKIRPGMRMRGYYQTYEYVSAVKAKPNFRPLRLASPSEWYVSNALKAKETAPIMIHVRRGDYAKPENIDFGILNSAYFACGVRQIQKALGTTENPIWVFSDDINSVRKEFSSALPNAQFIVPPTGTDAAESLMLMTHGAGNVISNSTFSWWSAILSEDAVVVAPTKWFKNMPDPEALLPSHWLRQESSWI
jgi:hypothetical protein